METLRERVAIFRNKIDTMFDKTKQVLCVMQVVEDAKSDETGLASVMTHAAGEKLETGKAETVVG